MKKRLPIGELRPGMYLVGIGKPELETMFFNTRRWVKREKEITLLKQYGISEVIIDPTRGKGEKKSRFRVPQDKPNISGAIGSITDELPRARSVRYVALETVQTIFQEVEKGGRIHSEPLKETVSGILNSLLRCREASLILLHMREFDNDLFNHAVNVCVISLVVGKDHGLDEQELTTLGMGALLHDVGWMCFPRELLHKQGVITDQERKLIEEHPNAGVAILTRSGDITEEVLRIVAAHHERLDGTGYPAALKGEDISSLSRIVAITNIFDSMISGRRGQPVSPPTLVLQHLYHLGTTEELDHSWVEQTIRSLGVYPVGSLVELDTGERAIIMAVNPVKTLRPVMKLIQDEEQQFYPEPPVVDISVPAQGEPIRLIRRALDPAKEGISLAQYLG